MAETLITGHELILKVYDEEGGELLYSEGFSQEPNMDVDEYLAEHNISLSGDAEIEICCELTGDCQDGYSPDASFQQILSEYPGGGEIERCYTCTEVDEEAGKCTYGETLCRTALEIPATVEMRVYGALNKENNQHGAIFTWHSVRDSGYSAMQGPAPIGYHVPSQTEWQSLINVWTGLGGASGDSTSFGAVFKIPFAGYRTLSNSGTYGQGSRGYYWTTTPYSTKSYQFALVSGAIGVNSAQSRSLGNSLRCFKDEPVIPTANWTKLYGISIEAGGIFWSSTDGLISLSSDGTTWITILDKNLGATTVWNSGDTLSEANCGKYYQWGNNYGFNWNGTATTSTTLIDASTYGPGNYYNSSTFIIPSDNPYDRSSVQNDNLWGAVTGVQSGYKLLHKEFYLDYSAMRGPCPEGYHIPLNTERQAVYNIWTALGGGASAGNDFLNALKMPKIGRLINQNGTVVDRDNYGDYRSSAPSYTTTVNNASFYMHAYNNNSINPQDTLVRPNGMCLRAFKDEPVVPNSTRTMLYGTGLASGGIFWDQTAGLISMSSDGATWITIRDKNEGATSVYSNGDTKTAANCGGYYQRGNNHLFPFGSGVTTGAELVDTTGYGPGNYYSGTTFIVTNTSPNDWSSIRNDNLRGGVTGAVENGRRVI